MASNITKQDVRRCLSTAVQDCHTITLYYLKQDGQEMWLIWGEKVLIREIWLNIDLSEMLNGNRKLIAQLILHLLDYF